MEKEYAPLTEEAKRGHVMGCTTVATALRSARELGGLYGTTLGPGSGAAYVMVTDNARRRLAHAIQALEFLADVLDIEVMDAALCDKLDATLHDFDIGNGG